MMLAPEEISNAATWKLTETRLGPQREFLSPGEFLTVLLHKARPKAAIREQHEGKVSQRVQ